MIVVTIIIRRVNVYAPNLFAIFGNKFRKNILVVPLNEQILAILFAH
jgi:hypothetical protein